MTRIPLTRPDLGPEEEKAAARVLASGWLVQGPEVAAFEAELAAAVGAPHAVAVSSGTAALELSLRAVGVRPGDDVVTVSHSFVATANAVVAVGGRPVFVDVLPETLGMDPGRVPSALTPRTRAILCVHQLGIPCAIEAILDVAKTHGLPVVEDAACALGSEALRGSRWEPVGRPWGAVACFSFHPRKVITTGEGGMVTTADPGLAARVRRLRQHGIESGRLLEPGFNHRMTDMAAAIGRVQLRRLGAMVERRRDLAQRVSAALRENGVLAPPSPGVDARWNWQSYPAFLRDGAPPEVDVLRFLEDNGVSCKRGVENAHEEPGYRGQTFWLASPDGLAVSERLRSRTILLPLFSSMTENECEQLLAALRALPAAFPR